MIKWTYFYYLFTSIVRPVTSSDHRKPCLWQDFFLNTLPIENTESFLLLFVREASWKSKSIMSCSNIWYVRCSTWFMCWPVFLLTCCTAIWDLQRDENIRKHSKQFHNTYEMASRAPLILRNTSFSLTASPSTASLQNLVLRVGIVVCPSPDIVFHPEILGKPEIVLGFFGSIHWSGFVVEVRWWASWGPGPWSREWRKTHAVSSLEPISLKVHVGYTSLPSWDRFVK